MIHFFLKWILSRKIICVERKKNALYSNHVFITERHMATVYRDVRTKSSYRVDLRSELGIPIFNKPSRKEAIEARNRMLKLASDGVDVNAKEQTFGRLLKHWRLSQERNINVGEDSFKNDNKAVNLLQNLTIKGVKFTDYNLEKITTAMLQDYVVNYLYENVAPKTGKNRWCVVTGCFNYAVNNRLISTTPCQNISLPKSQREPYRRIDPDDIWQTIAGMENYKLQAETAVHTGMRAGEMRALGWEQVHLGNRSNIRVIKSLSQRNVVIGVKKGGAREIEIGNELAQKLRKHYDSQTEKESKNGLVFPNSEGNYIKREPWRNALYKSIENINKSADGGDEKIERFTWHDLRHFYASVLIFKSSYSPATITYLMGHKNIDFTYTQYGMWLEARSNGPGLGDQIENMFNETRQTSA